MSLEQFIYFTTDIVGVDRLLRVVQSALLVVISYPDVLALIASLLATFNGAGTPPPPPAADVKGPSSLPPPPPELRNILAGIHDHVNLVRRVMRVFRFVETFYASYKLFESLLWRQPGDKDEPATKKLERWIDAVTRGFLGMYLFLEFLVLPDMMLVPGLHAWEPATAHMINTEALRFWLFGLAGKAVANLLRIYRIFQDVPMPQATEEEKHANGPSPLLDIIRSEKDGDVEVKTETEWEKTDDDYEQVVNKKAEVADEKPATKGTKKDRKLEALRLERERLKRITKTHMRKLRKRRHAIHSRFSTLARLTAADVLDITIPATVVGWMHVEPGTIGLVMLTTSFLTGYEVWKRCGADLEARKARS